MANTTVHSGSIWRLVRQQHGVVSRVQLLGLGMTSSAIAHRLRSGRLHSMHRGVYAVGRPVLTRRGRWMAAVLACGESAFLSHLSAVALWGLRIVRQGALPEVTVDAGRHPRPRGVRVHRSRAILDGDVTEREGIAVSSPLRTLIDIAPRLRANQLETAVNRADRLGLSDPVALLAGLEARLPTAGTALLKELLERDSFRLTDSELERRFLALVGRAGLPLPDTGTVLHGYKTDFHWPALGLVVETDGLTYHRTHLQQARDRRRDQAHTAAGLATLRFTHSQVRFEPDYVASVLRRTIARLEAA